LGNVLPNVKGLTTNRPENSLPYGRNSLPGMRKKDAADVLADNLRTLMDANKHLDSDRKLAAVSGVSHKTINNALNRRHDIQLSKIEALAKAFKMTPMQMLCPNLDSTFSTICKAYSVTDDRGRETLYDNAKILLDKADRAGKPQTGQADRG
jgi:transcriptional regulator with XRE-family HTH domain